MLSRRNLVLIPATAWAAAPREVELFDGRTPRGWKSITGDPFPERCWRVENGCLHAWKPATGAFQDIRTEEEFEYFEAAFEWKLAPGGNSGFKYSIQRTDTWKAKDDPEGTTGLHSRARGLEFQLGDEATPDVKRGLLYSAGSLYGLFAPVKPAPVRPGEFNEGRVVYTATKLEHWINGELMVRCDPSSAEFAERIRASKDEKLLVRPRRSPIALQNHSSPVWFRKLRVRRLE